MSTEGAVVVFPEGLPGFESHRRFELLSDPAFGPFTVLRGLGPGAPAFATVDPRTVVEGYAATIGDFERERLGATPESLLLWLVVVSPGAGGEDSTANLRAPIVICTETLRGLQIVDGWPSSDTASAYRFDHPFRAA